MKKYFLFGFGYFFALQGCIRLIEFIQDNQYKRYLEIERKFKNEKK